MPGHLPKPIAWAIAVTLLMLPGHASGDAAAARQTKPSTDAFPQTVDVITGKLKMKVFLHDVPYGGEKIPCWTYLTEGLVSRKQREIIFTLQRDSGQKPGDYPREVAEMFAEIFRSTEQGEPVDVGELSLLGDAGFLGNTDVKAIGYIEPERLPGVETGDAPLVAAILLKNDEAAISRDFGLSRVVALLGKKYHYYPSPPWSDLKRQPVTTLDAMRNSVLQKVAKAEVRASFYEQHNRVSLRMFSEGSLGKLSPFSNLDELPANRPMALLTQVDTRANACVVWPTEGDQHFAISPPNSDGSRRTGNFLLFVPEQNTNEIKWYEDGLAILLTNGDWEKIREAFLSGADALIPLGKDDANLSLEWVKQEYTSPVTGEAYHADEWFKYEPRPGTSPAPQRVSVSTAKIVLLTGDRDLRVRTSAEDLAAYLKAMENAVDIFFTPAEPRTQRQLTIQFALTPEGNKIQFVAVPDLTADVARQLLRQLESVAAPKVRGPVKLEYTLSLWWAANFYRKAAEQGDARAQNYLGAMYERGGGGLPKDYAEALRWYRKAADQGDATAQGNLGWMYSVGCGGLPKDEAEAVRWYRKAAEQGGAEGQNNLGAMYKVGAGGLPKDEAEALRLFRKAAEQGYAEGQANLGIMYEHGQGGLPKDEAEAVRWYRKAAEQGQAIAQSNLALMYVEGRGGLPKDEAEAANWFRRSAEQGQATAQSILGLMYEQGRGGLPKNEAEAVRLFRKAAEQDQAIAQGNLGAMYEHGRAGLPKDEAEAVRLFRKAADQGYSPAQNNLGLMYEQGRGGLPKDEAEAVRWFQKAAKQGLDSAIENLKRLHAD